MMKKSLSIGFLVLAGTVSAYAQQVASSALFSEDDLFLQAQRPQLEQKINTDVCTYVAAGSFYNLNGIYNKTGYVYTHLLDYIRYFYRYYESEVKDFPNWKVVFNFCKAIKPLNTTCPDDTFAGLINTNGNSTECYTLAKSSSDIVGVLDSGRNY